MLKKDKLIKMIESINNDEICFYVSLSTDAVLGYDEGILYADINIDETGYYNHKGHATIVMVEDG